MANKREFKKSVAYLATSMAESMMLVAYNNQDVDMGKVDSAVAKLLTAANETIDNANRFYGKRTRDAESKEVHLKAQHAYFKELFHNLKSDFTEKLNEAIKEFNSALPESVRQANKELAAAQ